MTSDRTPQTQSEKLPPSTRFGPGVVAGMLYGIGFWLLPTLGIEPGPAYVFIGAFLVAAIAAWPSIAARMR